MMAVAKAGEENWWSEVETALGKYSLPTNLTDIKELKTDIFREKVKKTVSEFAFKKLAEECKSLKKTASLSYESFKLQEYLKTMYPNQSKIVFKCRSKTLDIKTHLTYKYKDSVCRKCGEAPEEVHHIINCGQEEQIAVAEYMQMERCSDHSKV